ncbi:2-hydroxy-3-oxopropionate reductase [gamma proteobacterium BDW918]|jgi:3-hydroxyisobutyrate dehydrogenase-like beta-hydroxyacid dehydrogenase|uniref:Oxidoreductase n=1 Tax=Zhongshania aliphaticivorans TaxID=1470434 RepID=A0A127M4E8_9GAMM|nr:NAD(P)-dependent oxidoreductase [Zhongshania aliphaticivorans]AMO68115.1 oxidoreductase [Zhongshania aliphaticivorans]EIF44571.1 2-hydroxy-3-oxopropionate reductase [gamma proteobacterium BDW918]
MKVCFIGLGTMGYPMAGHLQQKGFDLSVYNRSKDKAQQWSTQYQIAASTTLAKAVAEAEIVAVCLGADADVREVLAGDGGVFSAMPRGGVVIDHSTTSAALAREMAACAQERGISFIDAPVSGGEAGAINGRLTVMAGGDETVFARIEPVLAAYATRYQCLGPVGSGQLAKMVNQICIAGLVQGLAEGMHFGAAAGLDMNAVLDVIGAGAAQSWQMDNRAKTMLAGEFDFGFAVDWMRKDLGYVLDEARQRKISLPVTALVDQFYGQVQNMDGGQLDTSSLLLALQQGAESRR